MIHQPYIGYIRDTADNLYRVAWAQTNANAKTFEKPSIFRSNRYDPNAPWDTPGAGALPTSELNWSPYWSSGVPSRVCGNCYLGDDEWWSEGDWPDGTPGVVLSPDGFATNCREDLMSVQSVGLAESDIYIVSGSPVTYKGILSLDLKPQPAGTVLAGPLSGPDAKPSFQDISTLFSGQFVARLSTNPLSASVLSVTLPGTVLNGDSKITFTNPDDYRKVNQAMAVPANGGFSAGCRTQLPDPSTNSVETDTPADANYSGNFTFIPDGYEWFEQQFDPETGEASDKIGGRSGTITTAPAVELNGAFAKEQTQVFLSLRETTSGGIPVYQFVVNPFVPMETGNSVEVEEVTVTDHVTETTITKDTVTTTNMNATLIGVATSIQFTVQGSPPPYPNSLYVDASGDLVFNDSMGNPQIIPVGGPYVKHYVVKYSDTLTNISGQYFYVLDTIPFKRCVCRVWSMCVQAWVQGSTPASFLAQGYVKTGSTAQSGAFNSSSIIIDTFYYENFNSPNASARPESAGGFYLTCLLGGISSATAGETHITVEYIDLP